MGNRTPRFHLERGWILLQCKKSEKRAGTIHRSRIGPDSSGLCSFQAGLGFSPPFLPKGGCRWGRSRLCECFRAALPGVAPAARSSGCGQWGAGSGVQAVGCGQWGVGSFSRAFPAGRGSRRAAPIPPAPRGGHRAEIRGCSPLANLAVPPRASPSIPGNEGTNTPGARSRGQPGTRKPYHLFLLIFQVLHKKKLVPGTCVTN